MPKKSAKKIKKIKPVKTRKKVLVKKKKAKVKVKKVLKNKVKIAKKEKPKKKKSTRQFARIVELKTKKVKSKKSKESKKTEKNIEVKKNKAKKYKAKKPDKSASHNLTGEFPAESLFKARIKVIGIGGGGCSIVSEIGRSLEKATFVVADTDIRALKKKTGIKYFWFGEELTHGLGTGVNVDLAKQAAESAKEKISANFKDQDIIIFIASLGGGLGSGATQVFAETARNFGGITFGIFTMPFKFEGKNKYKIAQNALKSLRGMLNVSLVIPNEKIFKIIDANTPITDAFSVVNKSLIESLESLIDLIYNPGVINIDFADLRTILRGKGNTAFLNTVEESGKNRAEDICKKVFSNPLFQNSSFEAEKILFNIAGSDNLSMFEVEKISSHITKENPKAKVIFGISKSSKLKNKIKTTILMTGGQTEEDEATEKIIEPVKIAEEKIKIEIKQQKIKKIKPKKPVRPAKKPQKKEKKSKKEKPAEHQGKPVSFIPVFEAPMAPVPVAEPSRMEIVEPVLESGKKITRRSGLEIKKAEEREEKKRQAQEKEWEIPAFLRRVKYKS